MIHGCEPNRKVNAQSCLVSDFFTKIEESRAENKSIVLPGKLSTFRTKNGGEALCPVDEMLHFSGPNPKTLSPKQRSASYLENVEKI